MDKLKIKDYIFITIPIVLMILVNIFCFVNHMTFVWKNPIDNVIFSSFPVSLLFPLLSFIFYKQTNDEKYRDKNEMVDPTDLRKTRLSTKGKVYLIIAAFVVATIIGNGVSLICDVIYNTRRYHDEEIIQAVGEALESTYDYYQENSSGIKSSKQADSYEIGFRKFEEGVNIFTCTELTSDTKEEDTFEDTFERFFEHELQEGDYGYALKPGEQSLRFADLKDKLYFADKDSELYVYMTDSVIVSGIKNPVKSLDKSVNDVSNKIVKREGLPSLLFYVVDDSDNPKHNTFAVDTFGQIHESDTPQNDIFRLNSYVDSLNDSNFYWDFSKVGEIDDFETYEVYQLFTSYYKDGKSSKVNRDELLKRLDKDFADGFKAGYDDPYRPPVSEEVSLSEMNVIGIYSSNEYYSLTDDKAWGDK